MLSWRPLIFDIMLFGPSKKAIWQQLAIDLDGTFVSGSFNKPDKVVAYHEPWEVVLDTYVVSSGNSSKRFTRMRAPYVYRDDFVFQINRKDLFTGIAKALGQQDVVVGYPRFDEEFVIQGNDERKLRMLFASAELRRLIARQPRMMLRIREDEEKLFRPKFPKHVNEVYFATGQVIKDLGRLHDLFDLFAVVLDQLHEIGTAWDDDPHHRL